MLLITKRKDAQALETAKKMVRSVYHARAPRHSNADYCLCFRYIREAWPELSIVVEGEVYDELRESVALIPLRPGAEFYGATPATRFYLANCRLCVCGSRYTPASRPC